MSYYWTGTIIYCLAMVLVGVWVRMKVRHEKGEQANYEFWIARRQLPGWRLAVSLTAGWLMLGWLGFGMSQIYMYGATALWILPIPWLILCFIIIFMVPYIRRVAAVSLPQGIEKRYGKSARAMIAVMSFLVFVAWTQAELFMGGKLMSPLLDIPPWACMVLLIAPIIIYMYLGGFRANVATDVVQFFIMVPFMIILAVVALREASAASSGRILDALQTSAPPWSGPGEALNPWFLGFMFPLVLLVGYLPGWMMEQDLVLRIQAARSTREARRASVLGLVLIGTFVIVLPSIIAFCAIVIYPPQNGSPDPAVGENAYNILSALIQRLPMWLSVFMLVGIVACQMSTVDTFTNVSALALAYDLIEPAMHRQGRFSPAARLHLARGVSVLVLLISLACAIISNSLQDVYYISSGVLSACVAVPAIFVFWKRTTLSAVLTSACLGFAGTVGGFIFEYHYLQAADPALPHYYTDMLPAFLVGAYGYIYVAAGVVLSLVSIIVVSLVTGPATVKQLAALQPQPVEEYERFVADTAPPGSLE